MQRKKRRSVPTAALLAALGAAALARAGDWPRFRGPGLDGHSSETGLLKAWPEGGPPVLWRRTTGDGYSGLTVAAGRLYTMFDVADGETAFCLDAATGKEVWRVRTDSRYRDERGNGPRSTPAVDGGRVYVLGAKGKLYALDAATGEVLWRRDLVAEYGAAPPQWGVSTEPLVEGDLLLVNAGGRKGAGVIAFDKKTGEVRWKAGDEGAGYASPVPITVDGRRQVVFFTDRALLALAPETGRSYWRLPWETDWDVNAATPIFVPPNRLFVSSGYDTGAALLRIRMAEDAATVEPVWKSRVMKNQFSSSVIVERHIYGFDNRFLKCVALHTGEEKWVQGGLGHGSLLYADGHLIVLGERGRLVLVEATPEAYREKGSLQVLEGKCWTVPTLAGGRLYVRNEEELVCLKLTAS